jgi:DNA-binding MarR family transcriptional regulator
MHGHNLAWQILQEVCIMRAVSTTREDGALLHAWQDVLSCHARVSCALEKALERRHGIGLSEFDVLERLATAEHDEQHRMQELAAAVHLSQSALSRLVGRLEVDGLVKRCMCPEDRRGIFVDLTAEGRTRYDAARPTHRAVLAEHLPGPAPR